MISMHIRADEAKHVHTSSMVKQMIKTRLVIEKLRIDEQIIRQQMHGANDEILVHLNAQEAYYINALLG